jgi:Fe-S-cluster containining protein
MQEFFEMMKALYDRMQEDYNSVAGHYGFNCEGCTDNCCSQRFHHRTYAEYHYLFKGLEEMSVSDPERVDTVFMRTRVHIDAYNRELVLGELLPLVCPLLFNNKCSLYEYRPMMCRMHGLPHRFTKPDGEEALGDGCHWFEANHQAERRVDRTAHYNELAKIEMDLRVKQGLMKRFKKTTAQMLFDMTEHMEPEPED